MSIIKGTNQIVAGFGGTKENIGDVKWSYSKLATDNSGRLPLFTGETIVSANTIYPDFYNWILAHTELQCTSEEYENALSIYGECAKYVIGGGSLRLPKLSNYIKAANTAEGITQSGAGLPNITGQTGVNTTGGIGAFSNTVENIKGAVAISGYNTTTTTSNFDASRSSAVYGASDTVTPAHTTLYPWVVAYTAAIPASTAAAAEFQNALSGKLDLPSGKTQADVDFVVESYHGEDGNWYRKYKSGWVEQGGTVPAQGIATTVTITLLKAMKNNNYTVLSNPISINTATTSNNYVNVFNITTTSFNLQVWNFTEKRWCVFGQGAN